MKLVLIFLVVIAFAYAQIEENHSRHPDCQVPACPGGDHRNRTYPEDCLKYVDCSTGRGIIRECPSGYKYNQEARVCEIGIGGAGQGCIPCWAKRPSGL